MKIKIVADHPSARLRMNILIPSLIRHNHSLTNNVEEADIYFLDCMRVCDIPETTIIEILKFKGKIILTNLGDWLGFNLSMNGTTLPDELIDRAMAFVKLNWSLDNSIYNTRILDKMITIQPFLVNNMPSPSNNKKSIVSFLGLPTGDLDTNKNLRIKACRILKNKLWFDGGITNQEPGARRDISGVETGHRPYPFYLRSINKSLLSLCPPGNSVLTYRHFESMGMGSCIVTCCLDRFKWLNRMIPGYHYLDVLPDLSNLVEVCEQALDDKETTLMIAKNGYDLYNEYYRLMPDGGMTEAMWTDIKNQWQERGIPI